MAKKKKQAPDDELEIGQQPEAGDAEDQQPEAGDAEDQQAAPAVERVRVRLPAIVERRGGCLVDRDNGVLIAKVRYDGDGGMQVERTPFVDAALDAGDLVLVK